MQNFGDLGKTVRDLKEALHRKASFGPKIRNVVVGDVVSHAREAAGSAHSWWCRWQAERHVESNLCNGGRIRKMSERKKGPFLGCNVGVRARISWCDIRVLRDGRVDDVFQRLVFSTRTSRRIVKFFEDRRTGNGQSAQL